MPRYKQGNPKAFKRGYESYSKAYDKKEATLLKHDAGMKLPKMTEDEWLQTYISYRNDFSAQVKEGSRKQIGNINQYIISDQAYFMTAKQARNIHKAITEKYIGENDIAASAVKEIEESTITKLRTGKFDWRVLKQSGGWKDFLSDEYQSAKKRLGDAKKAHEYIQDFFFGTSPK